tara:strand:- start:20 stop:151 length:132 start_codon:yes stop_codon:yes gene_type:complete
MKNAPVARLQQQRWYSARKSRRAGAGTAAKERRLKGGLDQAAN